MVLMKLLLKRLAPQHFPICILACAANVENLVPMLVWWQHGDGMTRYEIVRVGAGAIT